MRWGCATRQRGRLTPVRSPDKPLPAKTAPHRPVRYRTGAEPLPLRADHPSRPVRPAKMADIESEPWPAASTFTFHGPPAMTRSYLHTKRAARSRPGDPRAVRRCPQAGIAICFTDRMRRDISLCARRTDGVRSAAGAAQKSPARTRRIRRPSPSARQLF